MRISQTNHSAMSPRNDRYRTASKYLNSYTQLTKTHIGLLNGFTKSPMFIDPVGNHPMWELFKVGVFRVGYFKAGVFWNVKNYVS